MAEKHRRLNEVCPKPTMVAYRRGPSLKDLLCRARMPSAVRRSKRQIEDTHGFSSCGQLCALCPFAQEAKDHMVDGQKFKINGRIRCDTAGCVYKILCAKCRNFVYYGETGRTLRARFWGHKNDIDHSRAKPVSEHFNLPGHDLEDLIFIGIERVVPTQDKFLRKQRETFYIRRSNAVQDGANRRY